MKNYHRPSGDGSVKAVVSPGFIPRFTTAATREPSPESNLPSTQQLRTLEFCTLPSTFCIERATPRREPLPYNSSPTEEVCPFVARAPRVRVTAPSRCRSLTLRPFAPCQNVDWPIPSGSQSCLYSSTQPIQPVSSFSGLSDLCHSSVASAKEDAFLVKWDSPSVQNLFKKAHESAIVHVSLTVLPAQKVDFLATPLHGYWVLAIGYFSVQGPTAYPAHYTGISHFISQKMPVVPAFSLNPTSTSRQNVDCGRWDFDLENSLAISARTLLGSPTPRLYLQKLNFSSRYLRKVGVVNFPFPQNQKSQKKPVSSPKFMFQHRSQTLCPSITKERIHRFCEHFLDTQSVEDSR
jgi:hypothetical protein